MFFEKQYNAQKVLVFDRWWQAGFIHGFINEPLNDSVVFPKQVHGKTVARYKQGVLAPESADAIYLDGLSEGKLFAVRSADCLPIIVRGSSAVALIHAGWRGLANGIITETLKQFPSGGTLQAVIGPAASIESYEVGSEVIEAIGESSVYKKIADKFFLSLSQTAAKQLANSEVFDCQICTIASKNWHSYRRDRDNRGSNFAFAKR